MPVTSHKERPLGRMVVRHHGYTAADFVLDLLVLNEYRAFETFLLLLERIADELDVGLLKKDEARLIKAEDVFVLFVFKNYGDQQAFGELERLVVSSDDLEDLLFSATRIEGGVGILLIDYQHLLRPLWLLFGSIVLLKFCEVHSARFLQWIEEGQRQ